MEETSHTNGVAILSVPHTGTHTAFNSLLALGYERVSLKHQCPPPIGAMGHVHFTEMNVRRERLTPAAESSHVLIPLRTPMMSFISKYRREIVSNTVDPFGHSIGYTVSNWEVAAHHLDQINHALVVPMENGCCDIVRIAEYLGVPYTGQQVEVGNMLGSTPSTLEALADIPFEQRAIEQMLEPANWVYHELLKRSKLDVSTES